MPEDYIYLTVPQAAQLFQVSPATLRRNLVRGTFPGIKIGGQWRVSLDVLDALFHPWAGAVMGPSRPVIANDADPAR